MSTKLTFQITLLTDFHVGSGYRKGTEIDSALLRESDNRPALRGSMLGQLLRDAARELLNTKAMKRAEYAHHSASPDTNSPSYCRQTDPKQQECPLCWIFGSPGRPRRWEFSSAWLKEAEKPGPESISADIDWAGHPVSRVRINPRTRRAADDQLFVEEVGDSRLVFEFYANWNGVGEADESEIAFLAAAASSLRHLGKSRRRGRGLCQVQLVAIDHKPVESDIWLEKFVKLWVDQTWQAPEDKRADTFTYIEASKEMVHPPYRVQVIARLEEPLLLANRALAGNQFDSLCIMPGNVLLGALAARGNFADANHYSRLIQIFRRGIVRFSALFPADGNTGNYLYPAFAAPLDIFRCKQHPADDPAGGHPDQAFSLDSQTKIACLRCPENDNAVEGLRNDSAYQTFVSGKLMNYSPQRREEMHIRLDPATQRVRTGDLFSYVALESGQYLVGEIICYDTNTWRILTEETHIQENQPVQLRIGKGIRRGYGLVSAVFRPVQNNPFPPLQDRLPDPRKPFRILLLSDTIVIDRWGRYPSSFSEDWLADALGFSSTDGEKKLRLIRSFSRSRTIDSFNNYLGLPRWRDIALIAGSAVGIQVTASNMSNEDIWKLLEVVETNGIGMRRNEGYGQVVINHPLYNELQEAKPPYPSWEFATPFDLLDRPSISSNTVVGEEAFCTEWDRLLGEHWKDFEHSEYMAVARFLRNGCNKPLNHLKNALSDFGKPGLERLPGKRLVTNQTEKPYASRTNKPFFIEEEGKQGLKLIYEKIDELEKHAYTDRQKVLGLTMLADRVADAAQRAR